MLKSARTQFIVALAIGMFIGWLTASGRLVETFAQENKAETSPLRKYKPTGTPGSPTATTTISGKQLAAARPEVRRSD